MPWWSISAQERQCGETVRYCPQSQRLEFEHGCRVVPTVSPEARQFPSVSLRVLICEREVNIAFSDGYDLKFVFNVYLCFKRGWEREREREGKGERERSEQAREGQKEREREKPHAGSALWARRGALELRNCEITTWAKIKPKILNRLSHPRRPCCLCFWCSP